jgi:hypothetical protein
LRRLLGYVSNHPAMTIANLSAKELRRAAKIKDEIEILQTELDRLLGQETRNGRIALKAGGRRKRRTMSASAKAKIAAAQRARWAKVRAGKK